MTPERFYQMRHDDWQQLTDLLDLCRGASAKLSPEQVTIIGRLYRAASSDLALAQRDYPGHEVTTYLNQLTARAHAVLYRGEPLSLKQVVRFFTHVIPQNFRATWRYTAVAMLMMFGPALLVGIAIANAPESATVLLPVQLHGMLPLIEDGEKWFEFEEDAYPSTGAFITANNIQVSFNAFAGGMTAGLLTSYVLLFNGLMLGGIVGYAYHHEFWSLFHFIVGHGVIELSMICVAGGAGLMLGWAIIHPSPYSRSDAIAQAAKKAVIMAVTCALFLIVAGLIEGFISPRPDLNPMVKYSVGIISGLLMYSYFFLAGREEEGQR